MAKVERNRTEELREWGFGRFAQNPRKILVKISQSVVPVVSCLRLFFNNTDNDKQH